MFKRGDIVTLANHESVVSTSFKGVYIIPKSWFRVAAFHPAGVGEFQDKIIITPYIIDLGIGIESNPSFFKKVEVS